MGVFAPFLIGSQMLIAVADSPPSFNVTQICQATAGITGSTPSQDDTDACLKDEQDARDAVAKEWAEFTAVSKLRCVRTSKGYHPSYVELQACLEIARDAANSPEENNQSKTQESTPEPPPARAHLHHRTHLPALRRGRHRSIHRRV